MSELTVDTLAPRSDAPPLSRINAPATNPLLDGAILPTLLRLSWPNVIALSAGTFVVIAETSYIGRLGTEALAAMALVFPLVMLMMTMSSGAMGGAVSSAISRALGADDPSRAALLAMHALLIALCFGTTFTILIWAFGFVVLEYLGGRGNVLAQASAYIHVFFSGAIIPWLMNTFASILRGTGNMKLPSAIMLNSAVLQIILGGVLGLGLGPVPQFGMPGVAAGTLTAFTIAVFLMGWYVFSGRARVKPTLRGFKIESALFIEILKVGAIACFSPMQSVLTITIVTRFLSSFGVAVLAGYGIGARLEFLLSSIAFAIGVASVPMVGMAVGAGRIDRARRIAWTAGVVSFSFVGFFGTLAAIFPDLWVNLFTTDQDVRTASHSYLSTAAPAYSFLGLATAMYFASQGAAKVLGPVLSQTARLIFIALGGWWLLTTGGTAQEFFYLAMASMVLLGSLSCLSVVLTRWDERAQAPQIQPLIT